MKRTTVAVAAAVALLGGAVLVAPSFLDHPAAQPAAQAEQTTTPCVMTPIAPMDELMDVLTRINQAMVHLVEQTDEKVEKPLPPGVTREKLAAEAQEKLAAMQRQMDDILTDAADRIEGKTESPHRVGPIAKPCG